MRQLIFTILLLFVWLLNAQVNSLNIELNQVPITDLIATISEETGYRFAFNPDILQEEPVSLNVENGSLESLLDKAFTSNYQYKIRGSYIILLPKKSPPRTINQVKISGEVIEQGTNKKLEGVSVYEVRTLKPVLTNTSGKYELEVSLPEEMAFISISKKNYQDTIIQVKKNESWKITLKRKPDAEGLKEEVDKLRDLLPIEKVFNNEKMQTHANNVNLTERRWIHLALTPGLSTNGFLSGQFTNKTSFNVIGGYSYALEGVEIGGALNMERSYVKGLQLSGGGNINGDFVDGAQFAGISNIVLGDLDGLQASGFSNHAYFAGGAQLAGAINTSRGGEGFQGSGWINWSRGTYEGVQMSGGINYTQKLKGIQIGVVNIADSVSSGFMLGVVNWTKGGLHHFEVSTNDVTTFNLAFKSGVKWLYTTLSAGINPHEAELWDYGMGLGTMHRAGKKVFWDLEASYHMIQPLRAQYIDGVNSSTRIQLRLGYSLFKHLKLIGGPIVHFYTLKPTNLENLSFADRFGKNAFSDRNTSYSVRKTWIGYELAVRF